MAVIHHTTLTPGKLELLSAWLPSQPWYRDADGTQARGVFVTARYLAAGDESRGLAAK